MSGPHRHLWGPPPEVGTLDPRVRSLRGAEVGAIRAAILSMLDEARVQGLLGRLPPEVRALLAAPVDPEAWVPVPAFQRLMTEAEAGPTLRGAISRLIAERDGGGVQWLPPSPATRFFGAAGPAALVAAFPEVYAAHFQGGGCRVDRLEASEAWVSLWMEPILPDFARLDLVAWFQRALAMAGSPEPAVTYLPPPPDLAWWHRYHLRWA